MQRRLAVEKPCKQKEQISLPARVAPALEWVLVILDTVAREWTRLPTTVSMVARRVPQMSRAGGGWAAAKTTGRGQWLCGMILSTAMLLHLDSAWAGTQAQPGTSNAANAGALLQAAAAGQLAQVEALLEQGIDANSTSRDGNARSALILAAAAGHPETVKALLVAGADTEVADSAGLTALNWSALRGRTRVAELLLQNGAHVNTRDNNGVSPLLYAVGTRNIDLLRLLVERGADPDVLSEANRMTPLLVAVENSDSVAARMLLDNGANVNGANQQGYSALMAAAESGQLEMARLLLARGADPLVQDISGASALSLAENRGHKKMVEILRSASGN